MAKRGDPPFSEYKIYGPVFDRREGRRKMFLIHYENGSRTTMTLARYRMCIHLGRWLDRKEEVDHKDNDRLNDDLENLQILTRAENVRKNNFRQGRAIVRLKCPACKTEFERSKNKTHLTKKGKFTACSRVCSGRLRANMQHHGITSEMKQALAENVIDERRVFSTI